jgi:uncharacterized coiled-coil protein SlyX
MWPRLIAQLVELLPHVTRLIPLADRYLTTRSAAEGGVDPSSHAALTQLTEALRSDLAAASEAQAQINSQLSAQLATQATQMSRLSEQLEFVTGQVKRLGVWLIASAVLNGLLLLAILVLLLHNGMHHSG